MKEHPADAAAQKQLESLQLGEAANAPAGADAANAEMVQSGTLAEVTALPISSNWLPPDVDEKVPPVEPGAACQLDEVLRQAGKRIEEFVGNVDRFTATELVSHESINKWGMASSLDQ